MSPPCSRARAVGQSDRGDLGIGEGHPGEGAVVGVRARPAQDVRHTQPSLEHRHMGEGTLSRHVAHRPDTWGHTHAAVDRDARRPLVEPQRTHAESGQVAAPPRGDQHPLAAQHRAVRQVHRRARPAPRLGSLDRRPCVHLHPLAPQDLGDQLGRLGLLGSGEARAGLDNRDAGSEAAHDLSDLQPYGPATDDEQRAGHGLGRHRTPVGPVRHVREHRWDEGALTGGEHQGAARRDRLALDIHRRRAGHPGLATDEMAALALEPIDGDGVVPGVGGLLPDARGHRRPLGRHD